MALATAPEPAVLSDRQAGESIGSGFDAIRRRRWQLIGFTAVALLATAIVTLLLTPLYESRVSVNVERRGNGGGVGEQSSTALSAGEMDQIMMTQIELVESDPVLRPATEKYHLLEAERQFEWLNRDEKLRLPAAHIVLKRLKVMRIPNTSIIRISYRADDPKVAADVVMMIAKSYIAHAFDSREQANSAISSVVTRQLADLKSKMLSSDDALASFARQLNFADPEQRASMLASRLLQLNTDYTAAQSDRIHKEALLKATQAGSLASVQISGQGSLLDGAWTRLNESKANFARVSTIFGEGHAEYQKSKNELDETQKQFEDLRSNAADRVAVDYRQSASREGMARDLLAETKAEVDDLTAKGFEYQRLRSDSDNYRKLYDDLERITREQIINQSFQQSILQLVDPARPSAKQVFPSMAINLTAGFFFWTMVGVGGILLLDSLDGRVHSPEDASKLPQVEVLAALPRLRRTAGSRKSGGVVAILPRSRRTKLFLEYQESVRTLRNSIIAALADRKPRSLAVAGTRDDEKASTIVANLGFSYALLNRKVLMIDADLREPTLHTLLDKDGNVGLANVITGERTWREAMVKVARENLFLMPAGAMTENSSDQASMRMRSLLESVYPEFDLVIVITPPILAAPEAAPVAASTDAVLVIARAHSTAASDITATYAALRRERAYVGGLVMTDVPGLAKPKLYPTSSGRLKRAV